MPNSEDAGLPPSVKSKVARQQLIATCLEHTKIESQAQLAQILAADGFSVTQATLSRDLDELGAYKQSAPDGSFVYRIPADGAQVEGAPSGQSRLARIVCEVLGSVDASGNIVVLRTPPGAAQYLASAIDHTESSAIIGTVAGDDTVLLVTRDPRGAGEIANWFTSLSRRRM